MNMKAHFTNAMETLKGMLDEASASAERAVRDAVQAVTTLDGDLARRVINGDERLDHSEVLIEEECLKVLALHQPVACDLREVVTILKVNGEIERVGDLAVNVAERVEDLAKYSDGRLRRMEFSKMSAEACAMLRQALDALNSGDAAMAEEIIRHDDVVDDIHRENYSLVRNDILADPQGAQYYLNGLTISRCLERIADIATNIAEDLIYLETGRIVRHKADRE